MKYKHGKYAAIWQPSHRKRGFQAFSPDHPPSPSLPQLINHRTWCTTPISSDTDRGGSRGPAAKIRTVIFCFRIPAPRFNMRAKREKQWQHGAEYARDRFLSSSPPNVKTEVAIFMEQKNTFEKQNIQAKKSDKITTKSGQMGGEEGGVRCWGNQPTSISRRLFVYMSTVLQFFSIRELLLTHNTNQSTGCTHGMQHCIALLLPNLFEQKPPKPARDRILSSNRRHKFRQQLRKGGRRPSPSSPSRPGAPLTSPANANIHTSGPSHSSPAATYTTDDAARPIHSPRGLEHELGQAWTC